MRTVADLSPRSVPWRGAAAFVLDNVVPLLGFLALTIGAFHLPGVWGNVGGYVVAGVLLIKLHDMLQDEIKALREQATADRIDRERAALTAQKRLKTVA